MKKILIAVLMVLFSVAMAQAQAPKSNWATLEGNKVHYYDIGNAKNKSALIFIHGWTCSADFWKASYAAFPGYRVIAVDLIGHGKSDKPRSVYSMEYFAKSVEAVVRQAKVQKAVLVGHSMGTPVARQFYRLYPQKTLAIVNVDGALTPFGTKAEIDQFLGPLLSNFKENGPKFVDGLLQSVKDDNLKKMIRDTMSVAPEHVAVSAMNGMIDERIWTGDTIKVPVLAIMAEGPFLRPDTKDAYKALAPNLDFQAWTGVSHFLMMEKPKEFNEAVRAFVVKNQLL